MKQTIIQWQLPGRREAQACVVRPVADDDALRDQVVIKQTTIENLNSRLAEAERTRAHELAYVIEACTAASLVRATHESRDALLDLRAWATSRASVKSAVSQPPVMPEWLCKWCGTPDIGPGPKPKCTGPTGHHVWNWNRVVDNGSAAR